MKYKIKGSKRAFTLVLLVSLVVAVGSILYWQRITQWLEQEALVSLRADGQESTTNISHLIGVQLQVLTTLGISLENPLMRENKAELAAYLHEQNKRNSFQFTGFQFTNGEALFSDGRIIKNFLSQSQVAECYEHSHYISLPLKNPFGGEDIVVLAIPVRVQREKVGIVFAAQPISFYMNALGSSSLGSNGLSLIVGQNGDVILSYPQALSGNIFSVGDDSYYDKGMSNKQVRQDIQTGREGITGYHYRGKHRFASYFPLGYNGWYVMLVMPTSSVAEKAQSLVLMSLILCLTIILALAFLLAFILYLQHKSAKALYKMGFIDPLLQTDNLSAFRLKFPTAVKNWKKQGMPFALALMNINQFKAVNDMYGFEQGDLILKQVSNILQAHLQPGELFCRVSADIFLLSLTCPDRVQLAERIAEILSHAGHNCRIAEDHLPLSLTCGIYVVEEETPFYIMLDRANLAWASAKQRAGGQYAFYDSEYLHRLVTEKRIESTMEQALENHEFKLYLQPKCDFKTGRIISAEALVRWQHGNEGMIRPDWFVPVFEKNGFVVKLDWYMLRQTVALLKRWLDEKGPIIPIGVNFSRLHLEDSSFMDQLEQIADESGVPHKLIEVELTESVVFGNVERMKQVIDTLHTKGFSVAMDDFGAGYSSLNVLKNLDFDCVKLDKEFLAKGEGNPRQRQVISGLVKMIKDLGCRVVAEGVETAEQAEFLSAIGCDMAQGYLYSRPIPAEEFEKKLKEETMS